MLKAKNVGMNSEFLGSCLTHLWVSFAGGEQDICHHTKLRTSYIISIHKKFCHWTTVTDGAGTTYHRIPNIQQKNYTQFDNHFASLQITTGTHNP